MIRTNFVLLLTMVSSCSNVQQEHSEIVNKAWEMEANNQNSSIEYLKGELKYDEYSINEQKCVRIYPKNSSTLMGIDSTYCFNDVENNLIYTNQADN